MLATAIIVFREVLEAALIIGIVLAATQGIAKRAAWVSSGVVAGIAGAGLIALFADAISNAIAGAGQEIFNASILIVAVIMLGWHNVWMGRHGREMAQEMKSMGHSVKQGERPMHMLAVVVGLAVLREGSEVVLFLYGIAAAQQEQAGFMLTGGFLGLAVGGAMGLMLYFGLLRISSKYLFRTTSWLITLLAAGMAAQAAGFLVQADLLPPLVPSLWDTSAILSQQSLLGRLLQTLIGYTDHPAGIQVLFYVITLACIAWFMHAFGNAPKRKAVDALKN